MRRVRIRRGRVATSFLLMAVVAALCAAMSPAWATAATMTDLGTLPGTYPGPTSSHGTAINDLGQVTGYSVSATECCWPLRRAFRWTPTTGMQDLGNAWSRGYAIDDLGQIAGSARELPQGGWGYAFRWTPSGGMQNLSAPSYGIFSYATAINALGQVTGSELVSGGVFDVFRWIPSGGMQDLGPGDAVGLNDLGQVALNNGGHAFRWTPSGGMQDLGTLGGTSSSASAINAFGQVTGDATTSTGDVHAFRWTP